MKVRKFFIAAAMGLSALLLSACKVNFITEIDSNGAGKYVQEIGFQGDEASMAGLGSAGEDFCASQNDEVPPGTIIRQETRDENETWCIYETPFASLDELKAIYGATDTSIHDISLADGKLTYDITLDLSGDSNAPMGADMTWSVVMPGNVVEHNAAAQEGNTLTWKLLGGAANEIRAVSEVGSFSDNALWYILGGGALLGFCCLGLIAVGGAVFFLVRRNKKTASAESPAESKSN
ncbi:MAG: hypothetical protein JETCAE02_27350 [Anaerolineaceae bacterium]|jgi:hypothetical protein|nr:hypothetical protein [Anaerolineae bacterium]MBL1172543.1 hypothetical protein [Chloroflexota bacterium]MBV6466605.1 hypothetical protein [Anaerolineales bacterium]MCE7905587.1 hypothetical protein [Anaerolineae bacterium CFX3]MDL1925360.1 hypothetical protein [Anaerolineae bacterium AMX1]GJQ40323.1 MAG: hypothetical protein JETCAE02_27350 [Anaerolineaceae bacterium]